MNGEVAGVPNLEELRKFVEAGPDLEVAVIARPAEGEPQVAHLALAGEAEQMFRDVVDKAVVKRIDSWVPRALDPIYKPDPHDLEYCLAADVGSVQQSVESVKDLNQATAFDPNDTAFKRRLSYSAIVLTKDEQRAVFFRRFTAKSELARKRGVALMLKDGIYENVDEEIFVFDEDVDCFVFEDQLHVVHKLNYRKIFEQLDAVYAKAVEAAGALKGKVPIRNFAEFEDACSKHGAMADKIIAISSRDYFDTLSVEVLEPVIEEFGLQIEVHEEDGVKSLVFEKDVSRRFRILKLMDDDFLRSAFTEHRYEANSKSASGV